MKTRRDGPGFWARCVEKNIIHWLHCTRRANSGSDPMHVYIYYHIVLNSTMALK